VGYINMKFKKIYDNRRRRSINETFIRRSGLYIYRLNTILTENCLNDEKLEG